MANSEAAALALKVTGWAGASSIGVMFAQIELDPSTIGTVGIGATWLAGMLGAIYKMVNDNSRANSLNARADQMLEQKDAQIASLVAEVERIKRERDEAEDEIDELRHQS